MTAGGLKWSGVVLVGMMLTSSTLAGTRSSHHEGCAVCRYTIIHRLFDACFIHFCYKQPASPALEHAALMKRNQQQQQPSSDWSTMLREGRAPKKNVPTEWWRPLGLLFWANHPDRRQSSYN